MLDVCYVGRLLCWTFAMLDVCYVGRLTMFRRLTKL